MRKILVLLVFITAIRLLPKAMRDQARAMGLLAALMQALALAGTANTSKAYATEQRTGALETRTGNLEQGQVPNVQPSSDIGQLQQGIFPNVNGSAVNITGFGGGSLYVVALKLWTNGNQVNYLNTLQQVSVPPSPNAAPSSYSQSWGQNVTGVINTMIAYLGQHGAW